MSGHYENTGPKVYGMVAEYDDPDNLVQAAKSAYKEGYRQLDAYSPFAIHGLAESIGFNKTAVPFLTLVMGLTGAATGFLLQAFGMAVHYQYDIGGRQFFSWPAFIPITFECMVLFGAFTCGLSMLALNGLPMPYHPIFNAKNFERASSDRFFLCIESADPKFDEHKTKNFLEKLVPKPLQVSEVMDEA